MSKEKQGIAQSIVILFVGAAISSAGFIVRDYFESVNRQEKFVSELQKNLYDEWFKTETLLKHRITGINHIFASNYGLSSSEISKSLTALKNTYNIDYWEFQNKLQKYGTSQQLEIQSRFRNWLKNLISMFNRHYNLALDIEKRAENLLRVKNKDSDQYQFINDELDEKIKDLIQLESYLYNRVLTLEEPYKNNLVRLINSYFRETLKLPLLEGRESLREKIAQFQITSSEDEISETQLPFLYADYRVKHFHQSEKIESSYYPKSQFERDIRYEHEYSRDRNAFIRSRVKSKFMNLVIQNNPDLESLLRERMNKQESESNSSYLSAEP